MHEAIYKPIGPRHRHSWQRSSQLGFGLVSGQQSPPSHSHSALLFSSSHSLSSIQVGFSQALGGDGALGQKFVGFSSALRLIDCESWPKMRQKSVGMILQNSLNNL